VGKRLDRRHSKDREVRRITLTHLLERRVEDERRMKVAQDREQWRVFSSSFSAYGFYSRIVFLRTLVFINTEPYIAFGVL
jgi:hypothetical protein